MQFDKARLVLRSAAVVSALGLLAVPAQATEGYFALGYGPVQRGQGGAGVAAEGTNAMASTINPAAVAGMGREMSLGLQLFMPYRGYNGSKTAFVAPGSLRSGHNGFAVPNFAYNMPLANGAVLNFAAYGNGGMNTSYPLVLNSSPGCVGAAPPGMNYGVFCGGEAGVDLNQLFLSFTYAQKVGNLSYGIAPTIAGQAFKAWGLGAFTGMSASPTNLTNNGYSYSLGYGLRGGVQVEVSPVLSVGASAQTKMKMSSFDKYAGLFAGGGSFDIPASATLGLAYKAAPNLTLMADVQRIFYSGVPAVSNPFPNGANPLGGANGPGFGWDDINVFKLGAVWKQSDKMTWRFGYAYSGNPIGPEDVTLNILAPGVVQHHLTVGGTYKMTARDSLDFSVSYVPPNSVTGTEMTPGGPGGTVTIDMHQFSASVGWTRKF